MKRKIRILRIWYYGKLPYAKRVKRWMQMRIYRELQELTTTMYPKYLEKYGNENYITAMELLTKKTD